MAMSVATLAAMVQMLFFNLSSLSMVESRPQSQEVRPRKFGQALPLTPVPPPALPLLPLLLTSVTAKAFLGIIDRKDKVIIVNIAKDVRIFLIIF